MKLVKRPHCDLIKAYAEGYDIEVSIRGVSVWRTTTHPVFSKTCKYRIKDNYTLLREALLEGKTLEYYDKDSNSFKDLNFKFKSIDVAFTTLDPSFEMFKDYEFQIKSEIRPFETLDEVLPHVGKIVRSKQAILMLTGAYIGKNLEDRDRLYITLSDESFGQSPIYFLKEFQFEDGTPCGVVNKNNN